MQSRSGDLWDFWSLGTGPLGFGGVEDCAGGFGIRGEGLGIF